ncbi:hypothetical protein ACQEU5_15155 [Marinactinospora thermotolerans]|uniref:Uncharacterized protein n=1 Tax=Marinactinospora thermotolerans DSM 45154 TaxID=1122192 RepID=A0A1T4RM45_9ACTN|nr:hypothetical protein [Marinactinospora thermotolerans]SKA16751.1 hypothetical protein SAMN02745673_02785 [Marinactinospora thermotolerans DSM 45154]
MPVSTTVRERARALLPEGAEIRYIFPASHNDTTFFVVIVTDSSVTVLANRLWSRNHPKGVWHVFPRNVRIGPIDPGPPPSFELGGQRFEIDDEYVPVVNAADAEVTGQDALPPDPFGGL